MSRRSRTTPSLSPTWESDCVEPQPWKPKDHMKVGCAWMVKHAEAILCLDPGLGKTSITLASLVALIKAKAVRRTLVVAPLRVCYGVWTHDGDGELRKWTNFNHLKEVVLHGPDKEDRLDEDADLYVVNPDGLAWLTSCRACGCPSHGSKCNEVIGEDERTKKPVRCKCHSKNDAPIEDLFKRGMNCLVIDELSKFKHTKTKRVKMLKPFLSKFRRRYGLTGSPAANGLLDLFGQAYVIDLGRALGKYITHYRFKYFMPTGYGGYTWVPKSPDTEKQIFKALRNLAIAMKADDCIDMPQLIEQNVWVDLPAKVRPRYDELEDELFAMFDDEEIVAANAAVASGKCRQVASGGLYVGEDPRRRRTLHVHDAKTDALVDLVEELQGSPLLVGYEFQHDVERIRKALGKDVPVIGGGSKASEISAVARRWNRGEIPVLLGHPQAMAHGLNLQGGGARHVCFYSTPWDYELYDQFVRRVWRQGNQNARVVVHRIAARKTVDEAVLRAISAKRRGQAALFDALRVMRQTRASTTSTRRATKSRRIRGRANVA